MMFLRGEYLTDTNKKRAANCGPFYLTLTEVGLDLDRLIFLLWPMVR
jgi:hypothetical protein